MKFYRYLIYRLYEWRLKSKESLPAYTVVLTMTIVHLSQLLCIWIILTTINPNLESLWPESETFNIILFITFALAYYLLLYKKSRWMGYIKEFKDEAKEKRKIGTIRVLLFTIGSVVLCFVLMIVLGTLFWSNTA